ncbi:MAG: NADP(H)-dependent aldo-keto reductase [Dongiaceae bacterium]
MDYRQLGRTDIKVSAICLGSMTWGEQNSEHEGHQQLDFALEKGVNFIDTAEMYPVPPRAETYGRTEEIIGSWLRARGNRDRVVLATKAAGPDERLVYVREGKPRLDYDQMSRALDASLARLGTDYVDLYQSHWPERPANRFGRLGYEVEPGDDGTPLEETLEALDRLVASGKVRHVGISNETVWGAMRLLALAEAGKGPRIVSIQNPYSLLNRSFEVGLAEVAIREQVGLLPYSPLAMGVLSGKYLGGATPDGARLSRWRHYKRYRTPAAQAATAAYVDIARQNKLDPAQMALAYVTSRPFVTATIVGATTMAQLATDIGAADLVLSDKIRADIEAVHRLYTYPAP